MLEAVGWGAVAASSLVLGVLLSFVWRWPERWVGGVLAFGAGALISAISFELAEEGAKFGGLDSTALGLGIGALTYFVLDGIIANRSKAAEGRSPRSNAPNAGTALALGAFLDGIPEQMALGIGLAAGEGISVGLLVAIFVSNLPEAIGSARDMEEAGTHRGWILRLWLGVSLIAVLSTTAGYVLADAVSGDFKAAINGFAAGALIVMLVDSMIPEAAKESGRTAGLITTLGFAVATALSSVS
jgi:ZIP family zinc transporter